MKNISINVNSGTIIKTILFLLLFVFLFIFRNLVLIILTAIVIASSIEPFAKWFVRKKIPRVLAVILVYLISVAVFSGIFIVFVPMVVNDISNFSDSIPEYVDTIDFWPSLNSSGLLSAQTVENLSASFSLSDVVGEIQSAVSNTFSGFWQVVSSVFGGLLSFILIIVFSFYFAVQEYGIVNFLKIVTPLEHEKYVIDLWRRSQLKIGRWMQGQILLALFIGILVYLGLMILGVKYAFLLALLAAFAELIPLFGPVLAAIPAVIIAFLSGGTSLSLMVVGLYVIIQQFENHLIYPLVVKKVVGVPPLLVIIALIVGAQLAGFLGVVIAVPIAAVLMEFINDREKEKRQQGVTGVKSQKGNGK